MLMGILMDLTIFASLRFVLFRLEISLLVRPVTILVLRT